MEDRDIFRVLAVLAALVLISVPPVMVAYAWRLIRDAKQYRRESEQSIEANKASAAYHLRAAEQNERIACAMERIADAAERPAPL